MLVDTSTLALMHTTAYARVRTLLLQRASKVFLTHVHLVPTRYFLLVISPYIATIKRLLAVSE